MITRLNVVVSVIFVIVFLFKSSSAQTNQFPNTPCPDVFQYSRSGNINIGLITVKDVHYGETTVAIELSQPGSINMNNPGHLSLNFNKNKVFEYLSAGTPFTYRVDFPLQNIIPRVTSIEVNGVNICSGPEYNAPSTTMMLQHTLNAFSSNSYAPQQSDPNQIAGRPSTWQSFGQNSQIGSNTPGFLKYSPSFGEEMSKDPLNQPSDFPPLSFNPSSFNSSSRNQPANQPTSLFGQRSFDPSPRNQPSYTSPSSFNWPSFNPSPQPSFVPSPRNQPSYTSPSSFNRPFFNPSPQRSYDPSPLNQPSYTSLGSFNQPSFDNPSPRNQPSYNSPSSFNNPSFIPSSFNLESSSQPSINLPPFPKNIFPPFDQSGFVMNPQNPFINKSFATDNNRPPGPVGPRSPPPTVVPSPSPNTGTELDPRNTESTTLPVPSTTTTTEKPHSSPEYISSICGRENLNNDVNTLNLNSKGLIISKARFPWIVAVFKKNKDDLQFQCGGSLISTKTVLSAAHCFYLGFQAMKPEDIMISMGRHNLTEKLDASDIDVAKIIPHPDYRPRLTNFDADLAIVLLIQSVSFTNSIRPICLWQGYVESRELEGVNGIIVGWGSDGIRNTTTVPTLVNATIVSELTCLRSNDQFYSLTSNRTLCAGNLGGGGPCLGDSGNGLIIRNRNKWMLRGTVSAAIGTPNRPCSFDQYAIYSDIAMFLEWIQGNMIL